MTTEAMSLNNSDDKTHNSNSAYLISVFAIWIPGFISNCLALFFIILDIRKITLPLLVLMLTLISSDLLAVTFSCIRHILLVSLTPTYLICVAVSFLHAFFKMTSGVVNSMMAVDRVLAICYPFFYERHIRVTTWKVSCFVATVFTAMVSALPWIGLGSVIIVGKDGSLRCAGLKGDTPMHKVHPFVFSLVGAASILTIVACNMILITALLKLHRRNVILTDTGSTSDPSSDGNGTVLPSNKVPPKIAYEIAFAKLMFGFASAYLVCGSPNYVRRLHFSTLVCTRLLV